MLLNEKRLRVMEEFVRDYNAMLTASYIAKKKNLNQKSVANTLTTLEKEGFFKSKTSGKNKYFFLNLPNKEVTINFISLIEHLRTIKFYKKNPVVKEIVAKIMPYLNGVAVIFGSYAKDIQKRDSDLDLFIAGSYNKKEIEKISETYKLNISIKNYPLLFFNRALSKKDFLLNELIKDHIIILNAQQFVSKLMRFYYGKD